MRIVRGSRISVTDSAPSNQYQGASPSGAAHRRLVVGGALAGALLVALAAVHAAGVPEPASGSFLPNDDFAVTVDGKVVPAETYLNRSVPGYLLISPALPSAVLLRQRSLIVESVPPARMKRQDDASIELLPAPPQVLAPLVVKGAQVTFAAGAQQVAMTPRPSLIGDFKRAELEQQLGTYRYGAAHYEPAAADLAALKKTVVPVNILVVFGSWCPHCREHVPQVLRLERELAGAPVTFSYHGIEKDWKDPMLKALGVDALPTVIVNRGAREIGRMTGSDWKAPETFLRETLAAPAATGP